MTREVEVDLPNKDLLWIIEEGQTVKGGIPMEDFLDGEVPGQAHQTDPSHLILDNVS